MALKMGKRGHIWLVTGASTSGKTTFCQNYLLQKRLAGWQVAGILTPAVFENGEKSAFQAVNLSTGESRLLAVKAPGRQQDILVGEWALRPETLHWGNQILDQITACDLLVIDELGPLEFLQGGGWQSAFPLLERGAFRLALVVVRPQLVKMACSRFRIAHQINVQTSPSN
ncbi:MAG: nucleoside-triphosphatase [Chloroflexota bacterium]